MTTSGASLREHLAKVGRLKAVGRRADTEAHLRLSPGERIAATLRLSQSALRLFGQRLFGQREAADDAPAVWCRVNERLRAARRR
jgi:hypothetical protein